MSKLPDTVKWSEEALKILEQTDKESAKAVVTAISKAAEVKDTILLSVPVLFDGRYHVQVERVLVLTDTAMYRVYVPAETDTTGKVEIMCRIPLATILTVEGASFGFPEVKLGLHPGLGGGFRLPALIDPTEAMTLIEGAVEGIADLQTQVSLTQDELEAIVDMHTDFQLTAEGIVTDLSEVDLAEAMVNLETLSVQLEASYSVAGQIVDMSLFEYLR